MPAGGTARLSAHPSWRPRRAGAGHPHPAGRHAALFTGRTHSYEGRGAAAVVHGVRTAAAAGARTLVVTNGCGALNPAWAPGTPVLLSDHVNLTGATPWWVRASST